ncbi:hypothetical protein FFI94_016185 [Rhodococcus sp. KBS0724]|uniref:hypothetical protein n=1 Tax=Rhodococcus sp. KBS0724 TaxID=1179674 RepID=UPI00110F1B38|nr:hypothetical protein [Rhodococcus sp. KBS0724]TSD47524.1 hypothetical protein FFI94_016185 [Rhodococcus sp. KBS0724]
MPVNLLNYLRVPCGHASATRVLQYCDYQEPPSADGTYQRLNPILDDRAPGLLLRDGDLAEVGPQVLAAARQFAAVG